MDRSLGTFLTIDSILATLSDMKEIAIKVDDELYRRASAKGADLEAAVYECVAINGDDDEIRAARTRMGDFFKKTKNFGVGVMPSREEMQRRGSERFAPGT